MQLLTSSRMRAFRTCKRLHYYKYELKRRPRRESAALSLGSIVHAGLEQWYLAKRETRARRQCYDLMRGATQAAIAALDDETELDEFGLQKALEMLRGYHVRWSDWADGIDVLDVEPEFTAHLINPATGRASRTWLLAGKLDLVFAMNGRPWFMEHKTTTSDLEQGGTYWLRLRMDGQVSGYFAGMRALGYDDPAGCLYDVLKKPLARPLLATPEQSLRYTKGKGCKTCGGSAGGKGGVQQGAGRILVEESSNSYARCIACQGTGWAEEPRLCAGQRTEDETPAEYGERIRDAIVSAPDQWYAHAEVQRLDHELKEFQADAWVTAKAIRDAQLTGGHARNPDACYMYNRFCEYWDVCTGCADIDDDTRFCHSRRVHPELSEKLVAGVAGLRPKEEADDENTIHGGSHGPAAEVQGIPDRQG